LGLIAPAKPHDDLEFGVMWEIIAISFGDASLG
jgi:hypothetical protein